jgi:RNA polymerase sigma-70 factor (ECF subfamily)
MKAEEFHKTFVPLRDRLLQQALRLSAHDADTSDDLVQETLLRLWELRDKLSHHPNVEALASTILRNKWNDHWRRSQHTLNDEQLLKNLQDNTANPPDDMELIDIIVSHLPPLQQQIFRMKEIEGYEKEEIMLVTGCSDESLRQNLSRARKRIRELYIRMRGL